MKQAFNLADESRAIRGRVHAVVRVPVLETAQRSPPVAQRIIQRPPCAVQCMRKRGGVT